MNTIKIDLARRLGSVNRNLFGGFDEHLGGCVYGGSFDPGSPLADEVGLQTDVLDARRRLKMPVVRYPGGNFVAGYRWMDGVGPAENRLSRPDLAWETIEPNLFCPNEFIKFCRKIHSEPSFLRRRVLWLRTLDEEKKSLSVYVINRSEKDTIETTIRLDSGQFSGSVQAHVVNGPDIKTENSVDCPDAVRVF